MISVVVISKDEPFLQHTLAALARQVDYWSADADRPEVVVVDASAGRLASIRAANGHVRWIDYESAPGSVTIAKQRNTGVAAARGSLIVFTDSGAIPAPDWLERLTAPIRDGDEQVVSGRVTSDRPDRVGVRGKPTAADAYGGRPTYLDECATINLAFQRTAFDAVGGFDESFAYGSDVDFSWRLRTAGYRIRFQPDAAITVDWGDTARQARRSFAYGRARARLYRKHKDRLRTVLRDDPVVVAWPLFLLGLPLALRHPTYLLLLTVPAWRARHLGVVRVLADHVLYGAGVLREVASW